MVRHRNEATAAGAICASDYLKKPYTRQLVPEDDGSYRGEILEFPGCYAEGDTAAEALASLEAAAESWLEAAIEMRASIHPPMEEYEFSGKLVLRLPKSLHRKAAMAAHRDGVSLNQFIVASVAEHSGVRANPAPPSRNVYVIRAEIQTANPPSQGMSLPWDLSPSWQNYEFRNSGN